MPSPDVSGFADITKLRFSQLKLYGRAKELGILKDVYTQVCDPELGAFSRQVVTIRGYSGTGKSSLVEHFMEGQEQHAASDDQMATTYFVSGKFDQLEVTEPYSGLVTALTDLCDNILESDKKDELGAAIQNVLGSEAEILSNIIPKINEIIGDPGEAGETIGNLQALNRLKFLFRAFIRTVCACSHPVVLFIDDLQWADAASLDVINAIATDTNLTHFLFVGAFRDNEVDEGHPLTIQLLKINKEITITEIQLGNLDVKNVNKIVSTLTGMETANTQTLSNVIFRKTHGNVFFVIQFLRMLQEEGYLCYSTTRYQWTWDMEAIESETDISENVVDLVTGKIRRLSEKLQSVLKVAACLWSTIDVAVLESIMTSDIQIFPRNSLGKEEVIELLDEAVKHFLVEEKGKGKRRYKFSHDRIQQGAYSLVPAGRERDLLHLQIGYLILQKGFSLKTKEWVLFTATNQLNRGSCCIKDKERRVDLARLNLKAGEMAISLSAFVPAANYLSAGIDLIDWKENWQEQYHLSLKLYSTAAEMAICNGDLKPSKQFVDEVLANALCFRDKLRVYLTLIESLGFQERFEEAMDLGFRILAKLGERFPKKITLFHVLVQLTKTKRMLRGLGGSELSELPLMDDEDKIATVKLLALQLCNAFYLQKEKYFTLLTLRSVQLTLQYGVDRQSPSFFACYGSILCCLSEWKKGYEFGRLALKLSHRLGAKEWEAQLRTITEGLLNHWQQPFQDSLEPLLHGHRVGVETGDIKYALMSDHLYCTFYFYSGLRLVPFEKDLKSFARLALEHNQLMTYNCELPMWQAVLNLMGRSDDPLQLTGEAMNQEEFTESNMQGDNVMAIQLLQILRAQLAYYFGNNDLASEQLGKFRKFFRVKSDVYYYFSTYLYGLVSLEYARRTRRRKFKIRARKIIKTIQKWACIGSVNVVHWHALLQAEYVALLGRTGEAKELYDCAIRAAARGGFLQDGALANERAGIFFLGRDDFWSSHYLSHAHELYIEWGAQAKADHLAKQYPLTFRVSESRRPSSGLKGRSMYSEISLSKNKIAVILNKESSNSR